LIAHDAKQAFHLVKSEHPDLVVSDIRMPHGGGMTLLREVKQWNPVHPKIFLMTGYLDDSLEEAIAEGAEDVFLKPLKLQEIVDRVSQVFERSNTAT
jgi:DNA-binding NtrC family response regulator